MTKGWPAWLAGCLAISLASAGSLGAGEVHQLLGQHVPGHEFRHDEHVGIARDP